MTSTHIGPELQLPSVCWHSRYASQAMNTCLTRGKCRKPSNYARSNFISDSNAACRRIFVKPSDSSNTVLPALDGYELPVQILPASFPKILVHVSEQLQEAVVENQRPQDAGLFQLSGFSDLVIQPEMQTLGLGPAWIHETSPCTANPSDPF